MDSLLYLGALIAVAVVSIWAVIQDTRTGDDSDVLPGVHNADAHTKSRSAREIRRPR
jgi:hypothetical protein